MAQIRIDHERCNKDGLCAAVCPAGLIRMDAESGEPVAADYGDQVCIVCGHCQAVCPKGALTVVKEREGVDAKAYARIESDRKIGPEQADQFLRSRRSVRAYKDRPVDRGMLEQIMETASFAPNGHNDQPVYWAVAPDRAAVERLGDLVVEWMLRESKDRSELAAKYHLPGVARAWKKGKDILFRGAPVLLACHTPETCATGGQDGALAMGYAELAAYGHGLGACWAGYFLFAAWSDPSLLSAMGVPQNHRIQGAIFLGHPASRYGWVPPRIAPRVTWLE